MNEDTGNRRQRPDAGNNFTKKFGTYRKVGGIFPNGLATMGHVSLQRHGHDVPSRPADTYMEFLQLLIKK